MEVRVNHLLMSGWILVAEVLVRGVDADVDETTSAEEPGQAGDGEPEELVHERFVAEDDQENQGGQHCGDDEVSLEHLGEGEFDVHVSSEHVIYEVNLSHPCQRIIR